VGAEEGKETDEAVLTGGTMDYSELLVDEYGRIVLAVNDAFLDGRINYEEFAVSMGMALGVALARFMVETGQPYDKRMLEVVIGVHEETMKLAGALSTEKRKQVAENVNKTNDLIDKVFKKARG
jgi:hypothetical protein